MVITLWFTQWFGNYGWLIALAIGIGINVPLFLWARWKRHLTTFGCLLAGFFGISLWMIGPFFYIVLLIFFISSSLLTKYRKKDKEDVQDKFDKGGERDTSQVLANGLAGFIFAVGHLIVCIFSESYILSNAFIFAFIAAIATTNADTWATEIGILSEAEPYWILNLKKKVKRGTSGGVSLKGTIASFIGALLIAGTGLVIELIIKNPIPDEIGWELYLFFLFATIAGFIGGLVDSFLGATIQGFFECQVCGKGTEKRIHCNKPTKLIRGKEHFRNDAVNFCSSLVAGIVAFGLGLFGFLI